MASFLRLESTRTHMLEADKKSLLANQGGQRTHSAMRDLGSSAVAGAAAATAGATGSAGSADSGCGDGSLASISSPSIRTGDSTSASQINGPGTTSAPAGILWGRGEMSIISTMPQGEGEGAMMGVEGM